jgi:hypothetical protein
MIVSRSRNHFLKRVGMGREFSDAALPVVRRCAAIGERKELPEDVCGCRSGAGVERCR